MNSNFAFRPVEPGDSPALAQLVSSSPSSGPASFTYDYQAGLLEIHEAFADDLHGIAATAALIAESGTCERSVGGKHGRNRFTSG